MKNYRCARHRCHLQSSFVPSSEISPSTQPEPEEGVGPCCPSSRRFREASEFGPHGAELQGPSPRDICWLKKHILLCNSNETILKNTNGMTAKFAF